jgi:outer membrane protein
MRKLMLSAFLACFFVSILCAQEKWDLRKCVEYAVANAISVKQADIQKRLAEISLRQNKYSRIPNANFDANAGYQFGRSINPATNLYTSDNLSFTQFNLNADITIFNWNRIANNITAATYESDAAVADVEKAKNDIALAVATAYLQALLSKVQIGISDVQLQQTKSQLSDTRKRVDAGSLPELNALDLEAQASRDSANLITAKANYEQSLLNLKAYMNYDFALPFDIVEPDVQNIPVESIAELQPDVVYQVALKNQPAQKANELRYKSLVYSSKAARSAMYPTLTGFGGLSTNASNQGIPVFGDPVFLGYSVRPQFPDMVTINGTAYPVATANIEVPQSKRGWSNQVGNNFQQNVGLALRVPIFNSYQARSNYERSKVDIKNQEIVKEQTDQKLKQDIYTAYTTAVAALQKFNASQSSVATAQRAYDIASKRYGVGLLSTLELIISQTNLNRAKIDLANSQYDFVFKMKVLEYYKGQGIKL